MSAYTSLANVVKTMPGKAPLSELTSPSAADAVGWIASASAQIDVAFAMNGQAVPVTDQTVLDALDIMVSREVAYTVVSSRWVWSPGGATPFWAKWHDEFTAMIELIRKGGGVPMVITGAGLPTSSTMDAPEDETGDDGMGAKIKRNQEW